MSRIPSALATSIQERMPLRQPSRRRKSSKRSISSRDKRESTKYVSMEGDHTPPPAIAFGFPHSHFRIGSESTPNVPSTPNETDMAPLSLPQIPPINGGTPTNQRGFFQTFYSGDSDSDIDSSAERSVIIHNSRENSVSLSAEENDIDSDEGGVLSTPISNPPPPRLSGNGLQRVQRTMEGGTSSIAKATIVGSSTATIIAMSAGALPSGATDVLRPTVDNGNSSIEAMEQLIMESRRQKSIGALAESIENNGDIATRASAAVERDAHIDGNNRMYGAVEMSNDDTMRYDNAVYKTRSQQQLLSADDNYLNHRIFTKPVTSPQDYSIYIRKGSLSNVAAIWTILKFYVGLTMISQPYALAQGGWISLIAFALVAFLAHHCSRIFCFLHRRVKFRAPMTYSQLGFIIGGTFGYYVVIAFNFFETIGVALIYLIFLWDNLLYFLRDVLIANNKAITSSYYDDYTIVLLFSLIIVLPTVWVLKMDDMRWIYTFSVFVIMALMSLLMLQAVFVLTTGAATIVHDTHLQSSMVLEDTKGGSSPVDLPWTAWKGLSFGVSIFLLGFRGHGVLPDIKHKMERPYEFPHVLNFAFWVLFSIYIVFCACGYITYGRDTFVLVTENTLLNPPFGGIVAEVIQSLLIVALWASIAPFCSLVSHVLESNIEIVRKGTIKLWKSRSYFYLPQMNPRSDNSFQSLTKSDDDGFVLSDVDDLAQATAFNDEPTSMPTGKEMLPTVSVDVLDRHLSTPPSVSSGYESGKSQSSSIDPNAGIAGCTKNIAPHIAICTPPQLPPGCTAVSSSSATSNSSTHDTVTMGGTVVTQLAAPPPPGLALSQYDSVSVNSVHSTPRLPSTDLRPTAQKKGQPSKPVINSASPMIAPVLAAVEAVAAVANQKPKKANAIITVVKTPNRPMVTSSITFAANPNINGKTKNENNTPNQTQTVTKSYQSTDITDIDTLHLQSNEFVRHGIGSPVDSNKDRDLLYASGLLLGSGDPFNTLKDSPIKFRSVNRNVWCAKVVKRVLRTLVFFSLVFFAWFLREYLAFLEVVTGGFFILMTLVVIPSTLYIKLCWKEMTCADRTFHVLLVFFAIVFIISLLFDSIPS